MREAAIDHAELTLATGQASGDQILRPGWWRVERAERGRPRDQCRRLLARAEPELAQPSQQRRPTRVESVAPGEGAFEPDP